MQFKQNLIKSSLVKDAVHVFVAGRGNQALIDTYNPGTNGLNSASKHCNVIHPNPKFVRQFYVRSVFISTNY